jgi:SAM-dependent methyltransferase
MMTADDINYGGYDDGYRACDCFWGTMPGSLLKLLEQHHPSWTGLQVLDVGCGEGKNAAYLAERGAAVLAVDVSPHAIRNARSAWPTLNIDWRIADVLGLRNLTGARSFDLVIAYGLLHCMKSSEDVAKVIDELKDATGRGGYNILCAFNERQQDIQAAHPNFHPTLLPHRFYIERYSEWDLLYATDTDLVETHPHNSIRHTHSLTRILARKR